MSEVGSNNPGLGRDDLTAALQNAVEELKEIIGNIPNADDGFIFLLSTAKRLETHLKNAVSLENQALANFKKSDEARRQAAQLPLSLDAFEAKTGEMEARDREIIAELAKIQSSVKDAHQVALNLETHSDTSHGPDLAKEHDKFEKTAEILLGMEKSISKQIHESADDIKQVRTLLESWGNKGNPSGSKHHQEREDLEKMVGVEAFTATFNSDVLTNLTKPLADVEKTTASSTSDLMTKMVDTSAQISKKIETLEAAFIVKLEDVAKYCNVAHPAALPSNSASAATPVNVNVKKNNGRGRAAGHKRPAPASASPGANEPSKRLRARVLTQEEKELEEDTKKLANYVKIWSSLVPAPRKQQTNPEYGFEVMSSRSCEEDSRLHGR
ncbi:hypothetical protein B0T16DRAFT_513243 [Cercophora newfieldiana]|uniref:Uncharacterized protein n=1 Tax=Cercophora newfieldiana TaxID=92897 RepID=A0AA40CNL0_9PEZI|nr:hypothetical protein B0T16DRAFT_513243 [Cercophora newfieldiana]